jgi:Uma2 family endonuclease
MATDTTRRATLDDLSRVEGKAELIGGRIEFLMPSGDLPSFVAGEIFFSLRLHTRTTKRGVAYADGVGYAVDELPSGRESFSPDSSYYDGPHPPNPMRFLPGPPKFAAEVRSENDYTTAAELEIAAKRADYFLAGTEVVWDVDPMARTIRSYRASDPANPIEFRSGDRAHAEPAVPGWSVAVDDLFAY